jgi:DNA-binding protein H-NS
MIRIPFIQWSFRMQISDIDICGKPADECDTVELVAALNAIKEKVRLYAQVELQELEKHRQTLLDIMNGDAPMPAPDEAPKAREVKPKYRHPKDMILTWSGRGKKPGWMQDWIAAGNDMNELLIAV